MRPVLDLGLSAHCRRETPCTRSCTREHYISVESNPISFVAVRSYWAVGAVNISVLRLCDAWANVQQHQVTSSGGIDWSPSPDGLLDAPEHLNTSTHVHTLQHTSTLTLQHTATIFQTRQLLAANRGQHTIRVWHGQGSGV